MKIEIEIADEVFETIKDYLSDNEKIEVTVEELKMNGTFINWLSDEIPSFYSNFGLGADMFEDIDNMGLK